MSRHTITTPTGKRYAYGYDRPTSQYFLDAIGTDALGNDEAQPIVGFDAPGIWARGTAADLTSALLQHYLMDMLPSLHRTALVLDLPIPDSDQPIPTLSL